MTFDYVILTMGDRPDGLDRALASIPAGDGTIYIVDNSEDSETADPSTGSPSEHESRTTVWLHPGENLGVPGGRELAAARSRADVVIFLDDDAALLDADVEQRLEAAFREKPRLAVVTFRLRDEFGETSRRHIPRVGRRGATSPGPVAYFLGGACAIRTAAYDEAGGYWSSLHYSHEELDLSWRLADKGWGVSYDPEIEVWHPRTPISRHARGWWLTGRNRVMVARRNLPAPVLVVHTLAWAVIGGVRATSDGQLTAYWSGWLTGWKQEVPRNPVSWGALLRITRAGRVPIV